MSIIDILDYQPQKSEWCVILDTIGFNAELLSVVPLEVCYVILALWKKIVLNMFLVKLVSVT